MDKCDETSEKYNDIPMQKNNIEWLRNIFTPQLEISLASVLLKSTHKTKVTAEKYEYIHLFCTCHYAGETFVNHATTNFENM